jgi:hypothetical protein
MKFAVTFTILAWGFSRDPYFVHFTSITKATGSWQEPCKTKMPLINVLYSLKPYLICSVEF